MATFHPFPRLPVEIRIIIWQMTVEPRQVEFRIKAHPRNFRIFYATSTTPIPAVMHACHESRNLGLYQRGLEVGNEPRYIWVNFDIDMISTGKTSPNELGDYRHMIRRLKFQAEDEADLFFCISAEWDQFTNLNEMHVVCEDCLISYQDAWKYLTWPCPRDNIRFIDIESGQMLDGYTIEKLLLAYRTEDEA